MPRVMKKHERAGEIAVAEIGGGLSEASKRIREVEDGEFDLASAYVELRHTRRKVVIEETSSVSVADGLGISCSGPAASVDESDCGFEPYCLSNMSSDLVQDGQKFPDPVVRTEFEGQTASAQLVTLTYSGGSERSKSLQSFESLGEESVDMESTAGRQSTDANSNHGSTLHETPSESEIEEFFAAAEKDLHSRFSKKYNFDIVKGLPMEGRYEWVPAKP